MKRTYNCGLQQYEIICDKCKEKYIEDDVRFFEKNGLTICEICFSFKEIPHIYKKIY